MATGMSPVVAGNAGVKPVGCQERGGKDEGQVPTENPSHAAALPLLQAKIPHLPANPHPPALDFFMEKVFLASRALRGHLKFLPVPASRIPA